jgi:hypothetical protein
MDSRGVMFVNYRQRHIWVLLWHEIGMATIITRTGVILSTGRHDDRHHQHDYAAILLHKIRFFRFFFFTQWDRVMILCNGAHGSWPRIEHWVHGVLDMASLRGFRDAMDAMANETE